MRSGHLDVASDGRCDSDDAAVHHPGKRIDVTAVALHARLGVAEMVDLDLAYAPPFSPVWDPVQTAARVLEGKLSQRYPAAPAPLKV